MKQVTTGAERAKIICIHANVLKKQQLIVDLVNHETRDYRYHQVENAPYSLSRIVVNFEIFSALTFPALRAKPF